LRYPFLRNDPGGDVDIEITAAGLRFVGEGGPSASLPFSEIREVRLFCTVLGGGLLDQLLRTSKFAYCCVLSLGDGNRIALTEAVRGPDGRWIVESAAYRTFVFALHEQLRVARTHIIYRAGLLAWRFVFDAYWGHWVHVGIAESRRAAPSFLRRGFFATLLRNWPRRYQPGAIPASFVPPA